jgi:formaldehyde-activating enzyme involved in methanogenesis
VRSVYEEAITRAKKHQPTVDAVIAQKDSAKHPFA